MSKYFELLEKASEELKKDAVLRFPGACSENKGIVISCGCATKAGDYAKKLGATKVAIIADKIIIQLGMLDPITDSLDKQGIAHCYFCDIAPEPHTDDLLAAVALLILQRLPLAHFQAEITRLILLRVRYPLYAPCPLFSFPPPRVREAR